MAVVEGDWGSVDMNIEAPFLSTMSRIFSSAILGLLSIPGNPVMAAF
jgi:hypothetical protein